MDSGAGPRPDSNPEPGPLPITPDVLADLQAGLLDDATSARVRRRARSDPEAARILAGLDTVRRTLAQLGSDEQSAPQVPAAVTAGVGAALRSAPPAAPPAGGGHALPRPRLTRVQWAGIIVGISAVATAVILGALSLTRDAGPAFPAGPTAAKITVGAIAPTGGFPLSDAELRAALSAPRDLGPLADPQRLGSCLTGLGHSPTAQVLGGRQLTFSGRPAVLLLVAGGASEQISAVLVEPSCTAVHTGLRAETVLAGQ